MVFDPLGGALAKDQAREAQATNLEDRVRGLQGSFPSGLDDPTSVYSPYSIYHIGVVVGYGIWL